MGGAGESCSLGRRCRWITLSGESELDDEHAAVYQVVGGRKLRGVSRYNTSLDAVIQVSEGLVNSELVPAIMKSKL